MSREYYSVHCETCDMHTGKMPEPVAIKAVGNHAISTGHEVRAEMEKRNR